MALSPLVAKAQTIWDDPNVLARTAPEPRRAVARARAILDEYLVDYPGSRFKDVHLILSVTGARSYERAQIRYGAQVTAFCGKVNAPNRMGGMTGWREFAVILQGRDDNPLVLVAPDGVTGIREIKAVCPTAGETVTSSNVEFVPGDWTSVLAP